jgi:hypothetical protein
MTTYSTKKMISDLSAQTELFLHKAVSEWQTLPHHRFAYKASPGSWSANQCLAHLNSYGRYYLPLIEKALANAASAPTPLFTAGWLGNYFTQLMKPGNDGVPAKKMKAPKDHDPDNKTESHLVIAEFIEQQEKMLILLRKAEKVNLQDIKIPISIAKWIRLRLGDTFHFLIVHNYRHVLQAERALAAAHVEPGTELENVLPAAIDKKAA